MESYLAMKKEQSTNTYYNIGVVGAIKEDTYK